MVLTSLRRSKGSELFLYLLFCSLSGLAVSGPSIYELLKAHGFPMGLLLKGVKNFTLDDSGNLQVHLEKACNAKFENEIHYDRNVSATLSYGLIAVRSGVSAQDLFLWFPVKEIRVDVPSSGLIYFDVGVVSKQFSLSSFETPRDCVAVLFTNHDEDAMHLAKTASKVFPILESFSDPSYIGSQLGLPWLHSSCTLVAQFTHLGCTVHAPFSLAYVFYNL